jgi:pimeloyl-ACP methyl ester carboxylesterase
MILPVIAAAGAAYALYAGGAYLLRNRFVYAVAGMPYGAYKAWPYPGAERLEIGEGDAARHGFLVRATEPSRGLVVLLHGNAMVAPDVAYLAAVWRDLGFDVLSPEYAGFGGSAGRPDSDGIVDDVLKLVAASKLRPGKLVLHGISLGGGVAAEMTKRVEADALVLQSTFASISAVASRRFKLPGGAVARIYPTATTLAGFKGRSLVIHATRDPLFPIWNGRTLAELLGSRIVEVEGSRHMVHDHDAEAAVRANADWLVGDAP